MSRISHWFTRFAKHVAALAGHPATFASAAALVVVWGLSGPLFDFSDTWQLVINTSTTILTFLMVFVIQNTQNRDTEAIQIKLDELIKVTAKANNALLRLDELDEGELEKIKAEYEAYAEEDRQAVSGPAKPRQRKRKARHAGANRKAQTA